MILLRKMRGNLLSSTNC